MSIHSSPVAEVLRVPKTDPNYARLVIQTRDSDVSESYLVLDGTKIVKLTGTVYEPPVFKLLIVGDLLSSDAFLVAQQLVQNWKSVSFVLVPSGS